MSENEFEVYLRLIAKLLRLSDAQREAISDELRDHMEARLEELMDTGLSREQAIHSAVEEFGDAAGLAGQFTRITRQHTLRRRIMRSSIGALAAAAAIALAFLYMLPQNRPGVPGPAGTHAEEVGVTGELSGVPVVTAGEADPTLVFLSQRISVDFSDQRLENVIRHLGDATGVNIFVNWTVLDILGAGADYPVTLSLNDTPADTVLSLLFQLINPTLEESLDYAVMDGVVVIASESEINDIRVVRIYDCVDLIDRSRDVSRTESRSFGGESTSRRGSERASGDEGGYGAGGYGGMGGGGGYGEAAGGYGGAYGAEETSSRAAKMVTRFTATRVRSTHNYANELLDVMRNLLDDGNAGSISVYDDMLVVIAGHKTHQRIQETLVLLRKAQEQR